MKDEIPILHKEVAILCEFDGRISLRTDVDTLNEIHERMDTDYPNSEHIIYPLVRKTYRRGCIAVNIKMPELPGKLHCYAWYTRIK